MTQTRIHVDHPLHDIDWELEGEAQKVLCDECGPETVAYYFEDAIGGYYVCGVQFVLTSLALRHLARNREYFAQ